MQNYITFSIRKVVVLVILSCIILIFATHLASYNDGIKLTIIVLFFFIGISLVFSSYLLSIFLLLALFSPYMMPLHQVSLVSILLFFSVMLNYKGIIIDLIRNPFYKPFAVYTIAVIVSYFNVSVLWPSLRDLINLLAFYSIFTVTIILIKESKQILFIFGFFIIAVFLYSLQVVYIGITTGQRVFGLLGVNYIDFAGIGSVLSFLLIIYSKSLKKILFVVFFFTITVGLFLTQTRNAWVSTGFSIGSLIIYLSFKGNSLFVKRYLLIVFVLVTVAGSLLFVLTSGIDINKRSDTKNQTLILTDDPSTSNVNSYFTRLLIWHTAVNAIVKHPIIGIGAYSFKHSSQNYYTIPKAFYKLHVKNRTPHVTYLQVLTETGIFGLITFLLIIYRIIKEMVDSLKKTKELPDVPVTLMIVWSLVYIVFSMFMTESWLYGQYIVWFGILLGLLVNNRKRLETAQ